MSGEEQDRLTFRVGIGQGELTVVQAGEPTVATQARAWGGIIGVELIGEGGHNVNGQGEKLLLSPAPLPLK